MKRLFKLLSVMGVALLLALGGGGGYLWATGGLDAERIELIAAVLRGEKDAGKTEATTTAPASRPADESLPQDMSERIEQIREQEEIFRRQLAREIIEAGQANSLLEQMRIELMRRTEELEQERKDFEAQLAASSEQATTKGFQKDLELLAGLTPKQAKRQLMRRSDTDAARILSTMSKRKAADILKSCKTEREEAWMDKILQKINRANEPESETSAGLTRRETPS